MNNNGEIMIYQSDDGLTRIEVKFQDDTVWLTQAQLSKLYQTNELDINEYIKRTFDTGEFDRDVVVRNFRTTTTYYNLDVAIFLGYYLNSDIAMEFKKWARKKLLPEEVDIRTSSYLTYIRACDFLAVASELNVQEDLKLIPLVVNTAFACELFLKALLMWENKKPKKVHKIRELFQKLEDETRVAIQREADVLDWNFFLDEVNDAFQEWRYLSERDEALGINVAELIGFAKSLEKVYKKVVLDGEE